MTMNEQRIRDVIAINNRCIEQFQDGFSAHAFAALRGAIELMNRVTIDDPTASTSQVPSVTVMQQQLSSTTPPQIYYETPDNHLLPQQSSDTVFSVKIKFDLSEEESSTNGSINPSVTSPIVPSFHLLRIVPVEQRSSNPEPQQRIGHTDATSKRDLHLISATLLCNMGLFLRQDANACHLGTHDAPSNSSYIVIALNIYELLIQLCCQIDIWQVSSSEDHGYDQCFHLRVIHMLAYNNYGEICYMAGRYDKYQHCMENLQRQLHFLMNMSRYDNRNIIPNSDEFQIIYNNLRLNALIAKLFPGPMLASAA